MITYRYTVIGKSHSDKKRALFTRRFILLLRYYVGCELVRFVYEYQLSFFQS